MAVIAICPFCSRAQNDTIIRPCIATRAARDNVVKVHGVHRRLFEKLIEIVAANRTLTLLTNKNLSHGFL